MDGKYVEFGEPDSVFVNDGRGRFTALDWKTHFRNENGEPVEAPMDFSQSVQIRDVNQDGHPDIYVCSDYQTPDRIWLGDGKGGFTPRPHDIPKSVSRCVVLADFDGNRSPDLFVGDQSDARVVGKIFFYMFRNFFLFCFNFFVFIFF